VRFSIRPEMRSGQRSRTSADASSALMSRRRAPLRAATVGVRPKRKIITASAPGTGLKGCNCVVAAMMWRRAGAGQCLRRCDTDRASSLIARLFWTVIGISWWASGQVWVVEDVVVRLKTAHRCGRIPRARFSRSGGKPLPAGGAGSFVIQRARRRSFCWLNSSSVRSPESRRSPSVTSASANSRMSAAIVVPWPLGDVGVDTGREREIDPVRS